jgi:hypothetical protein
MDLCKATYDLGGISFSSPMLGSVDINEIIEDDKKYGTMSPRNGEIFTYRVSNVHDEEITGKEMVRAVTLAWQHWSKRINIKIRKAKPHEDPDFRVIFRTVQTDERGELTDNTIMYHYFPIQDVTHSLRGLCVVDQVFTHEFGHGLGLPHDKQVQQVMSSNYGFMAEFPQERDVFRAVKKYGVPKQSPSWFSRWFNYLRHRSDNY